MTEHGLTQRIRLPWVRPALGVLVALGTLGAVTGQGPVFGGDSAQAGGKGTFQSATLQLSDTIGGTNCLSSPNTAGGINASNTGTCTTYPMATAAGSSTTTLANQGSLTPTAAGVSTTGSCGVQEFADTSTAGTNTGLPIGGTTYGPTGSGPTTLSSSLAVTFDGSTGWGETLTGAAAPANYTVMAWVKPSALNGVILGDTSTQSDTAPTDADRMIWINTAGRIGFGNDATTVESTAAAALSTGTWHFIVATKSTTAGMVIYINGSSNMTSATAGAKATLNYTGFWHLGWGSAVGSSFTTLPTTNFFEGSLADEAVFPTALSAAQVSALYAQTSQSALSTQVITDAPTSYWALQDTGSSLYSGAIANLAANSTSLYSDDSANPGTDYGTGEGTLGTDASGPLSATATTFNGSTGWIQTAVDSTSFLTSPGPQTFSMAAWFKTSTPTGGIISFNSVQTNTGGSYDRMLWLDPSGHAVFALYPGTQFELNSSASTTHDYADGDWHFVVVTVIPVNSTTATVLMYIDGALVAGSAGDETTSGNGGDPAQAYSGWWHIGWDPSGNWADQPTTDYWEGSMGQIAIFPTVLSAANVLTLYTESSASGYSAAVTGGVAASNAYWPLVATTAPSAAACTYMTLTIQAGSGGGATCVYPVASAACPATAPPTNWLSPVTATVPVSLPTLTFATTTTLGATTPPTAGVGLHVSVPLSITDSGGGFTTTLVHNVGYVLL